MKRRRTTMTSTERRWRNEGKRRRSWSINFADRERYPIDPGPSAIAAVKKLGPVELYRVPRGFSLVNADGVEFARARSRRATLRAAARWRPRALSTT